MAVGQSFIRHDIRKHSTNNNHPTDENQTPSSKCSSATGLLLFITGNINCKVNMFLRYDTLNEVVIQYAYF